MTKVLLGVVASASVIALTTTGTVYASRSAKPLDDAAIKVSSTTLASAHIGTQPIAFSEVLPPTIHSEIGYFTGTADGNGIWMRP